MQHTRLEKKISILKLIVRAAAIASLVLPVSSYATLYSFTNADGEYVVSQKPPEDKDIQYAVLSDEGEFIRMVPGRRQNVPITHWRPWFIPEEPEPWEGNPYPELKQDREPVVSVDEVGETTNQPATEQTSEAKSDE